MLFSMIALEFDYITSKSCITFFRVNVTLRSWILLMLSRKYIVLETLFSVTMLFSMIALRFDYIFSKF